MYCRVSQLYIHIYTYVCIHTHIYIFFCRFSLLIDCSNVEYSSMYYDTAGPSLVDYLLYIYLTVVCICESQTPNVSLYLPSPCGKHVWFLCLWVCFYLVNKFICHILDSISKWWCMVFVFLFRFTHYLISRSIQVAVNGIISFCFMAE